jgi:hypothetical protein
MFQPSQRHAWKLTLALIVAALALPQVSASYSPEVCRPVIVVIPLQGTCVIFPAGVGIGAIGEPGYPGASSAMLFDGSGPPTGVAGPGWSCSSPSWTGTDWDMACWPLASQGQAGSLRCDNAFAMAGGTPVTIGNARVRVQCGGFSQDCSTSWIGAGGCVANLPGSYPFPIHCRAYAAGTSLGGTFYAFCGSNLI